MLSTRDIRRKIRTVRNIQQICRAMKTVASIRLRRAEVRLANARPYGEKLRQVVASLAGAAPEHPFFAVRPPERLCLVVITADKGLCGAYNGNVMRAALEELVAAGGGSVVTLGRKGRDFFRRRGYAVIDQVVPLGGEPVFLDLLPVADHLGELFAQGALDRVLLVYTRFLSSSRHQVVAETVLPIQAPTPALVARDFIFEPPAPQLLAHLLPRYLRTLVSQAALEASASEHGARVMAMTAASDNAEEVIHDLTRDYHKARQAGITKEITEIVAAAEALA